jgi:hypothetical protein
MRATPAREYRLDPLDPRGIYCFLLLVALWVVGGFVSWGDRASLSLVARAAGYAALGCMAVPYVHIAVRSLRSRPGIPMSTWLRLHIASSYAGFALLLVHCGARAGSLLTLSVLLLTWVVMVSGVVGFYGQKLLYALLAGRKRLPGEVGRERLEAERERLLEEVLDEWKEYQGQVQKKAGPPVPAVVRDFVELAMERHLRTPFRFRPRRHRRTVEERYDNARLLAADQRQGEIVEHAWKAVEARAELETEYRLHQLGRLWLLFHGPAAWALLVLTAEHVWLSVWYGGF